MEQDWEVTRWSAPLGAVIDGLDVNTLPDAQWAALNDLFCEHHVLVFPRQNLTPEQQMTFARRWGELVRHPYAGLKDYPDIIELTNYGKRKDINQHWHTDMSYEPRPPKLTMLYAHEAPTLGGDTAFSNQILAYDDLSEGMKRVVDDLQAEHSAAGLASVYGKDAKQAPRAVHPVVRTHDESGARALFVCRAFTQKFVGWNREESQALLNYLYQHCVRPEYQTRHQWREGDLVMWDNRVVQHFAVHDHADQPRRIHRLQVQGAVPQ